MPFRNLKKILQPGGVVLLIIPRFRIGSSWVTISDVLLSKLASLGFQPERLLPEKLAEKPGLLYHRADQRVGREIWKFRFSI